MKAMFKAKTHGRGLVPVFECTGVIVLNVFISCWYDDGVVGFGLGISTALKELSKFKLAMFYCILYCILYKHIVIIL